MPYPHPATKYDQGLMAEREEISAYDSIAGMYHALWADWYLPAAMPALERMFFSQIPAGAKVLDLCCGSGHVTKELVVREYAVTGIDSSAELIALARQKMPTTDFRVQDARELQLEARYGAALSTFDSLNHILQLDQLRKVFEGVYQALQPNSRFVFDMNLEQAYLADLRDWVVNLEEGSVSLVRGKFDVRTKRASTELIWFIQRENGSCWQQKRSIVEQQCYTQAEILTNLSAAGFRDIEAIAACDAGVSAELGVGRIYFAAQRKS